MIGTNFCGEEIDKLFIHFDYISDIPSKREEIKCYDIERFNVDEDIDLIIDEIVLNTYQYLIKCAKAFSRNILNGYSIMPLDIQYYESEV